MKFNPTVALTFLLLALMLAAGMVSGSWGFAIGREALKGITQPEVRPTNNLTSRKGTLARGKEIVFLKEQDILKKVKAQMEGKAEEAQKNENKAKTQQ